MDHRDDYRDNYYVLVISIIKDLSPEEAFARYFNDKKSLKLLDIYKMSLMKKSGYTYKQIADIFNIAKDKVYYYLNDKGYLEKDALDEVQVSNY